MEGEIFYNPDIDEYYVLTNNEWILQIKPTTGLKKGYKWVFNDKHQWVQQKIQQGNPVMFYDEEIEKYKVLDYDTWVVVNEPMPEEYPDYGYVWSYDVESEEWIQVKESDVEYDDAIIKNLNIEEEYIREGYTFSLKVKLNLNRNKKNVITSLSIRMFIDGYQYGSTLKTTYDLTNIEYYKDVRNNKMNILKSTVERSPTGIDETLSINRCIFRVRVEVNKEKNSNQVRVQGRLDGTYIWEPTILTYNPNNMNNITNAVYAIFEDIRTRLLMIPTNYVELYSVDYLNFLIKVVYNKELNKKLQIKVMLDNKDYKTKSITFDIDNVTNIKTQTDSIVDALKDKLEDCPKMKTIEFPVRDFIFNIQQINVKMPGIEIMKTFILVDNIVRSDRIERKFNINDITKYNTENEKMIDEMKEKLVSLVPEDVRVIYTKDGVIYLIEVRFTKKKNSNVVVVSYYFNNGESLYLDYMDSYYLE